MSVYHSIALRYLFSKKSHSAINIVSLISVCGVAVGTMALVCVLSVYNGFQGVIEGLFSNFDPQVRIESAVSKSFSPDLVSEVTASNSIECFSYVIQDNALLKLKDKQVPVTVKGVDANYDSLTGLSSIMVQGSFLLKQGRFNMAITGASLAASIGSGVYLADPILLYAPKREGKISTLRPDKSFTEEVVWASGSFLVKQEKYDNSLIIVPIDVARSLFDYESDITSVDIKLKSGVNEKKFITQAKERLGDNFSVKNRYEQQRDFYRMMSVEKWITFLILSFILMIAAFNIIGSLSMLIIEKKEDIKILSNIGMKNSEIFHLFLFEGSMISVFGVIVGVIIGLILCWLQSTFGLISMGGGGSYIVNAYPVDVRVTDIVIIVITVIMLGVLASVYPAKKIKTFFISNGQDF